MLERFKKATETHNRNKNYQFWQYGNHAEEIYSHKFMWSKLDYIHLNPVRSGIVEKASYYIMGEYHLTRKVEVKLALWDMEFISAT